LNFNPCYIIIHCLLESGLYPLFLLAEVAEKAIASKAGQKGPDARRPKS
jgi:hypothetical protein